MLKSKWPKTESAVLYIELAVSLSICFFSLEKEGYIYSKKEVYLFSCVLLFYSFVSFLSS